MDLRTRTLRSPFFILKIRRNEWRIFQYIKLLRKYQGQGAIEDITLSLII